MSLAAVARRVTIRAPRVRLRSPIRSPLQSPVAYTRGNLFGVARTTLRVTRKTVTGTVFHPVRTIIIVLLVLLLFPAARPDIWWGIKHGAAAIIPGSYTCTPTELPAGGAAGVAAVVGTALHKLTEPPPTNAQMLAGMESVARTAGTAWAVFKATVNGAATPTTPVPVVPPAQQAGLTTCCPSTGGGTIPAGLTDTSAASAAEVAIGAGFPADQLVTAVAVAGAESGWNPSATHVNSNGSTDYGLWQINSVHADLLASGNWQLPADNARMALAVWKSSGWSAWVTFNSGAWQGYVGAARTAVAKAQGQLGPFLPVTVTTVPVATCTPAAPVSTGTTAAVAFALAQVGKPYVWGAAPMPTPTGPVPAAYDCSSLVQSALLAGGIGLPGRQTTRTLILLGVEVPASDIQAGDLVFPYPDGSHVLLAIGGGQMVEAPTPGQTVRRGPLYGAWRVRRLTTPIAAGPTV